MQRCPPRLPRDTALPCEPLARGKSYAISLSCFSYVTSLNLLAKRAREQKQQPKLQGHTPPERRPRWKGGSRGGRAGTRRGQSSSRQHRAVSVDTS
eukprot:282631-Pyramimonas_sp.AAC.1